MNKRIGKIIIIIISILIIILGIFYLINLDRLKNNKTLFFSLWGKKYEETKLEEKKKTQNNIISLEELPQNYLLENAIKDGCFIITNSKIYNKDKLEKFIENTNINSKDRKEDFIRIVQYTREGDAIITDLSYNIKEETYILSENKVNKSNYVLKIDNTRDRFASDEERKISIEENIPGEIYTIDLKESCEETKLSLELVAEINYENPNSKVYNTIDICSYLPNIQISNECYFYGKVIESTQSYIIVKPNEGEEINRTADKISVELGKYNDAIYQVGTNVKITYLGYVMESYPAKVEASKIEVKSVEDFEIEVFLGKEPAGSPKIHKILDKKEAEKYNYNIYAYEVSVNIKINGKLYPLRDALMQNKITMEEIIAKANNDLDSKKIDGDTYKDGGSRIYKYNNYTIIKFHKLDGNRDVYIGNKDMTINNIK